ncbi:transcription repressor OFP13-like [Phragmites australis]|uniref:transcription repressor OFP13-like n=1 Tax=Phragmites australis TaxID=29695 RepID=UPI002D77C1E4|nr:transcription repressor OFP13-like [Phragmites australis]
MVTRRLALSSLFQTKAKDTSPPPPTMAPAWPWPSCKNPRTQSSRAAQPPGARTMASIFLDSAESSFTASSARKDCSDSLSTSSEASALAGDTADDAVVRGLLSDRLLFDPGVSATSSILEEKAAAAGAAGEAFVGGVAVAFESADPYVDFRASMEEMVSAQGVGDWGWLEEMLGWYLRANDKDTHCAIVAAFIDVVVAIADPARASRSPRSSACTFPAVELRRAKLGHSPHDSLLP